MKCSDCGQKFRLSKVTLADSNPPGIFMFIALFFWGLAAAGFLSHHVLLLLGGSVLALISMGAMLTSTWDNNGGYGKPKCPHCKTENTVRFWHL